MRKSLLIVAAHPDDEVLLCGATVRRFADKGSEIRTLILGEGITSRDNYTKEDVDNLHKQAIQANEIIGSHKVYIKNFPDNRFDSVPLLNIVKVVSDVKNEFLPDMIITHHRNDLNIDHRRTYESVLTATRPMNDESVKTVLSGQVLSSTEWQYPNSFIPNVFFDITGTLHAKLTAMKIYKSELRNYPHPRSIEGITNTARTWGMFTGIKECEAFELVRSVI